MDGTSAKLKTVPGEEDRRQRAIRDLIGQAEWEISYEYADNEITYFCDRCGGYVSYKYPFCPWCGREMVNAEVDE